MLGGCICGDRKGSGRLFAARSAFSMFAIALPVSLLVLVVLMSVFKKERYLQFAIAGFVFSLFVMLYFVIPNYKPWQLFLISVPAVTIVFLACNIHRRPQKREKKKHNE